MENEQFSRLLKHLLTECRWLNCLEIGNKCSVIAFSLIRVEFSKRSNCLIEHIFLAQVAADHGGIARTGMRTCERPPTEFSILVEATFAQGRDVYGQLHISQLSHVIVDRA